MTEIDDAVGKLAEEMDFLPDWEERIAHVIELARTLEPLSDAERTEETRVRGCVSRVWLISERRPAAPDRLFFRGDSDAHLVRGEIAMLLRIFSGRTAQDILAADIKGVFERLGLHQALTQQRANGLMSMMKRIQDDARAALAASSHATS